MNVALIDGCTGSAVGCLSWLLLVMRHYGRDWKCQGPVKGVVVLVVPMADVDVAVVVLAVADLAAGSCCRGREYSLAGGSVDMDRVIWVRCYH